jgi:tetratricopeptide (TPR) repeat protein
MNQGRLKEAEDNYQRTISINPNFALAHLNLGVLLQRNNHLKEAEQSYNRAIFADPNLAQPHFNLSRLFEGQSRLREAEQAYRKAVAADPNYAQAYVNLNVLLENQNRLTEADQAYQAFLGADTPLDMEKAVIHFPSLADDKFIDQLKNAEMPKSLDFDTAFRNQLYYSKKVLWLEQVAREDQFVNALIDFDVEDFKSDSFRTRCLRTYMFAPSLDVSHELGFQAFLCTRSISELKKVAKNFPYMLNDKSFVTGIEYVIQSLPKHEHPEALQERLDALKQIQKNLTL